MRTRFPTCLSVAFGALRIFNVPLARHAALFVVFVS